MKGESLMFTKARLGSAGNLEQAPFQRSQGVSAFYGASRDLVRPRSRQPGLGGGVPANDNRSETIEDRSVFYRVSGTRRSRLVAIATLVMTALTLIPLIFLTLLDGI